MKKISALIIMAALLLGGCGGDENTEEMKQIVDEVQWESPEDVKVENQGMDEALYKDLQKTLVLIDTGELSGSGLIWEYEEDMVIVTAGHVLEQVEGAIYVTLNDGYTLKADLYWNCENSDLAFLKIDGKRIPKLHQKNYGVVSHNAEYFNMVQTEDMVYALGYRGMADALVRQGRLEDKWIYVEAFEQFMVLAQTDIVQGMSGGGLFDKEGHCIGILCGTDKEGRVVAVPSQVVEAEEVSLYW